MKVIVLPRMPLYSSMRLLFDRLIPALKSISCMGLLSIFPQTVFSQAILSEQALAEKIDNQSLQHAKAYFSSTWPKAFAELCPEETDSNTDITSLDTMSCAQEKTITNWKISSSIGNQAAKLKYPLGTPFETYNGNWVSYKLNPELGQAWESLPALVQTEWQYQFAPQFFFYFRMNLKRDLAAWHDDAAGWNIPFTQSEVNLNEPSRGYMQWANSYSNIIFGRFPIHWSPSLEYGTTLTSSVPYHDGLMWNLTFPHLQYHFLISSMNPRLEGTPDSVGENFPLGSEEYRQRHYSSLAGNAHNRIYTEHIKTLIAHRLQWGWRFLELGITELYMIGGKVPDLRDANPLVSFHNNFNEGYSNTGVGLDGKVYIGKGLSLFGETFLDDVQYKPTEGNDQSPSILGFMLGANHFIKWKAVQIRQSLHYIKTDPFLYNFWQPYNTLYSRHILTSNTNHQDSYFVDKYVIDYPIGYFRGADAEDIWYKISATFPCKWTSSLKLGILSQGKYDAYTPFEEYFKNSTTTSSPLNEEEIRFEWANTYAWKYGLSGKINLNWQSLENLNHQTNSSANRFSLSSALTWTIPY